MTGFCKLQTLETATQLLIRPLKLNDHETGWLATDSHPKKHETSLRWLNTVSSTYIWMGCYNHSLSIFENLRWL